MIGLLLFLSGARAQFMCGSSTATKTLIDSLFYQILWSGETAFVHTSDDSLYRSTDGGRTWASQMPFLTGVMQPRGPVQVYGVAQMIATSDPKTFFFKGYFDALWRTTDAGQTYEYLPSKDPLAFVVPHPTTPEILLGVGGSPRCYNESLMGTCQDRLLLSDTHGTEWRKVADFVYRGKAAWGHGARDAAALWTIDWASMSNDPYDLRLVSSEDEFKTMPTVRIEHAIDFLVDWKSKFMVAAARRNRTTTTLTLHASDDRGATFREVRFSAALEERFFTILEYSDDAVFVHVRASSSASWGHVYKSDKRGGAYALVLEYVSVRARTVEFRRMRGIVGVYVANVVRAPDDPTDARVLTMISHDAGSTWQRIDASRVLNADGSRVNCSRTSAPDGLSTCGLNFGVTGKLGAQLQQTRGAFYSSLAAPGVAVAVGVNGLWIDVSRPDPALATYMTRDGGYTWTQIRRGSSVVEIADQGNLIVLGTDTDETDSITWSGDAGRSWQTCKVTDEPMLINNIVSSPGRSGTEVIVMARRWGSTSDGGVVVHLQLDQYARTCSNNDYETWHLANDSCVLGLRRTYARRRQGADCHDDQLPAPSTQACECTAADYECDVCYERVKGVCSRMPTSDDCPAIDAEPSNCIDSWTLSLGYRRIANSQCSPPVLSFEPIEKKCSDRSSPIVSPKSLSWVGVVVVLLLLVAGVVAVFVLYRTNAKVHRFIRQLRLPCFKSDAPLTQSAFAGGSTALDDDLLDDKGKY